MSLDLNKLENKLDEALSNETSETLSKFLNDKRMTNNKQQTPVEWLREEITYDNGTEERWGSFNENVDLTPYFDEAREREVVIRQKSYDDGYREGYKRALDLMMWTIKEELKVKTAKSSKNPDTVLGDD